MPRKAKLDTEKTFEAYFLYREVEDRARLSTREIADRLEKQYGVPIDHTNISRAIAKVSEQIATDPALAKAYEEWKATRGVSGKVFYRTDPITSKITSDYVTVQAFIDRRTRRPQGPGDIVNELKQAEKCWLFLDKKDPANWELADVQRYLSEGRTVKSKPHTASTKLDYMISCRAVAPKVKAEEGATKDYKKHARQQNPIVKSPVFTAEYKEIIASDVLTDFEKFAYRLQNVLGCREGSDEKDDDALQSREVKAASIVGLDWQDYDARTNTLRVYESKVVGWWNNIPLDVMDPDFANDFRDYWESKRKPAKGPILDIGQSVQERYNWLTDLYAKIRSSFDFLRGKKFTPHFARKTHVNILWEAGVPLEIIAGDARSNEGYVGVGWTDLQTLKDYYLSLSKSKLDEYRRKAKDHFRKVGS